jgi:hypothetical protein
MVGDVVVVELISEYIYMTNRTVRVAGVRVGWGLEAK